MACVYSVQYLYHAYIQYNNYEAIIKCYTVIIFIHTVYPIGIYTRYTVTVRKGGNLSLTFRPPRRNVHVITARIRYTYIKIGTGDHDSSYTYVATSYMRIHATTLTLELLLTCYVCVLCCGDFV